VPELRPGRAQGISEINLFDVHVKQVGQQLHVVCLERVEQIYTGRQCVGEVRLVPIERLVEQRLGVFPRLIAECIQCVPQSRHRRFAVAELSRRRVAKSTLHRADDRGGTERGGQLDDLANECHRPLARVGIAARQRQSMLDPAGACADGGQFQATLIELTL
jgi:hypothetical protein